MPPRLVFEATAQLVADFGHLVLHDPLHASLTPAVPSGRLDEVAIAGIGSISLLCIGQMPEPHAHVQVWTAQPEQQIEGNDLFEGELDTQHTTIFLGAPTGAPEDLAIHLEQTGRYQVRVTRRAGDRVESDRHPGLFIELEHWQAQLWPVE